VLRILFIMMACGAARAENSSGWPAHERIAEIGGGVDRDTQQGPAEGGKRTAAPNALEGLNLVPGGRHREAGLDKGEIAAPKLTALTSPKEAGDDKGIECPKEFRPAILCDARQLVEDEPSGRIPPYCIRGRTYGDRENEFRWAPGIGDFAMYFIAKLAPPIRRAWRVVRRWLLSVLNVRANFR